MAIYTQVTGTLPTSDKRVLLGAVIACVMAFVVSGCSVLRSQTAVTEPPAGYVRIAEADLATGPYDAQILAAFTLDDTAVVSIYFTLQDVDIPFLELSLSGPDGSSRVMLRSAEFKTDAAGSGQWEESLAPGAYQVLLTAEPGQGRLAVYQGR